MCIKKNSRATKLYRVKSEKNQLLTVLPLLKVAKTARVTNQKEVKSKTMKNTL